MPFLLDTNVLIHLRDGDPTVSANVADLSGALLMSIVSRVELEGGVYRDLAQVSVRRDRLEVMLEAIPSVAFDGDSADAYATIVAAAGYSRRKLLDRMIARRQSSTRRRWSPSMRPTSPTCQASTRSYGEREACSAIRGHGRDSSSGNRMTRIGAPRPSYNAALPDRPTRASE